MKRVTHDEARAAVRAAWDGQQSVKDQLLKLRRYIDQQEAEQPAPACKCCGELPGFCKMSCSYGGKGVAAQVRADYQAAVAEAREVGRELDEHSRRKAETAARGTPETCPPHNFQHGRCVRCFERP